MENKMNAQSENLVYFLEVKREIENLFSGDNQLKALMLLEDMGPSVFKFRFSQIRWEQNRTLEATLDELWIRHTL
jgi:hypothetical protein